MVSFAPWSPGVVATTAYRVAAEYRNLGRDTPWLGNMVEQPADVLVHSSGYACTVDALGISRTIRTMIYLDDGSSYGFL